MMANDYWESSPFGKDSIFNPSFDENQEENKKQKDNNLPKIIDCYLINYNNFYKSNPLLSKNQETKKNSFVLVITLDSQPKKIDVKLNGSTRTAQSKSITDYTFVVFYDNLIPAPLNNQSFSFIIKAYYFYDSKATDTRVLNVTAYLNGNVGNNLTIDYNVSFEELQKAGELSPDDIKKYREFITDLTNKEKVIWYYELQKHTPYHSQRDNKNPKADVMCNLTTLGMNLEFLGISCPDKNMQFEDWLEDKRVEKKYPDRTDSNSWIKLAKDLGVKSSKIDIWTKKSDTEDEIKKIIFDKIEPYISQGHSVSVSAFTIASTKGHIVRLQSVNNDGIVVDDPYGRVNNFKQREDGGSGYNGSLNSRDNIDIFGKDNLWRWSDIKICTIKYIVVFYKLEK